MARRKTRTPEEIVAKLRQIEVETAKGQSIAQACRNAGITDQTYYRWRREYGGLNIDQAKRLKQLETENGRLKRVVADQALDIAILKEAARGNF
jgi:transposase-like protein